MKYRFFALYACFLAGLSACTTSPVTPGGVITVTVPASVAPANGAQIANLSQPVTLTITNATTTDTAAFVTYTFEVARDSGFANKVVSKDVPQGPGQTSLKLDTLPAGTQYFWRVRATAADTVGTYGGTLSFTIGQAIIIEAPALASPANGTTLPNARPTLVVTNAARTGPVGTIAYLFEIASDAAFANVIASGTVAEGATQTSFTPAAALATSTSFFWHAKATDTTNNISSAFSTAASFTTATPDPLWPGPVPPGTNGHAVRGDNWEHQDLISAKGIPFHTPTLEMLRLFDLFDKGFAPQAAIDWMHANGYPTVAEWYPGPQVIGVDHVYLALIGGRWHVVIRSE